MGKGTLSIGKKAPIYGHGDTLHWQKGTHLSEMASTLAVKCCIFD